MKTLIVLTALALALSGCVTRETTTTYPDGRVVKEKISGADADSIASISSATTVLLPPIIATK